MLEHREVGSNSYFKTKKILRTESVQGISDAVGLGCIDGEEMDKCTVLPASHVGG
jgi:hypothetical protein